MRYPASRFGFFLIVLCCSLLTSCSDHLCPAFQSTFILDDEVREKQFSLFNEDEMPKDNGYVKKQKNGVASPVPYRKRMDEMRSIARVTIYPEKILTDSVVQINPEPKAQDN